MPESDPRRPRRVALILAGLLILLGLAGLAGCVQGQGLGSPLAPAPATAVAPASPLMPNAAGSSGNAVQGAQPVTATVGASQSPITTTAAITAATGPTAVPGTKPARLIIPDLRLDVPVEDMTWQVVNTASGPQSEWVIPENAGGWAVDSALLGQPSNVVLSGHNNIFGRVFMPISQAWPLSGFQKVDDYTDQADVLNGRSIQVVGADGRTYNYVITAFYRLRDYGAPLEQRLKEGAWMDSTDHAQLTITTCWPPSSNTHRLILVAVPAS